MENSKITKSSILIAHIADTHNRDTQYARASRGIDFANATMDAVKVACKSDADILTLVGDIFDRPRPSPKVIGQLMALDRIIAAAGKKALAVTGNHDWCSPTWLATLFPEGKDRGAGIIPLDGEAIEIDGFTFAGVLPHTGNAFRHKIAEIEVQVRGADVVLYHGFVDGVVPFFAGLKDPLHVNEFPIAQENKAWLLGDIHMQGYMTRARPGGGETLIGYPGSTEVCSSSELKEKSVPLIRVTKDAAAVERYLPITTRKFISATVETEPQLEQLLRDVEPHKEVHPVVVIKFNRELTNTVSSLHSILDAQRAVIRCSPLPRTKTEHDRAKSSGAEELTVEHFISKRFEDTEELETVALGLFHRGTDDASTIVSDFIEQRLASTGLREDD